MKEITRIHLARTPFDVEIDAKKQLEAYLKAVQKALGANDDMIREIEARMVEILSEQKIYTGGVITANDVEAIKQRLGDPHDFADDATEEVPHAHDQRKRLMRDTERGMLGGVCAGISEYFGINVMWPRLVVVLAILVSFGTVVLLYIVLWLVVPAARTAAEKLQMRGESVTLASLSEEAREETVAVPERSKPFVLLLRGLLAVGFAVGAVGALVTVGAALVLRAPIFGSFDTFQSSAPYVIAAFVLMVVCGVLFALMCGVLAYMSAAWVVTKRLGVLLGVIIAIGLVSTASAVGLGIFGMNQLNRDVEQLKTTQTVDTSNLVGTTALTIDSSTVPGSANVRYVETTGTPRIELTYLRTQTKPRVDITRDGAHAMLNIQESGTCTIRNAYACTGYEEVTIYGPALATMTVQDGVVAYVPSGDSASVVVEKSAQLQLEDASLHSLVARVSGQGSLSASSIAVENVTLDMSESATASFGTVVDMKATVPVACASASDGVQLSLGGVKTLLVNGRSVMLSENTPMADGFDCATIELESHGRQ